MSLSFEKLFKNEALVEISLLVSCGVVVKMFSNMCLVTFSFLYRWIMFDYLYKCTSVEKFMTGNNAAVWKYSVSYIFSISRICQSADCLFKRGLATLGCQFIRFKKKWSIQGFFIFSLIFFKA